MQVPFLYVFIFVMGCLIWRSNVKASDRKITPLNYTVAEPKTWERVFTVIRQVVKKQQIKLNFNCNFTFLRRLLVLFSLFGSLWSGDYSKARADRDIFFILAITLWCIIRSGRSYREVSRT